MESKCLKSWDAHSDWLSFWSKEECAGLRFAQLQMQSQVSALSAEGTSHSRPRAFSLHWSLKYLRFWVEAVHPRIEQHTQSPHVRVLCLLGWYWNVGQFSMKPPLGNKNKLLMCLAFCVAKFHWYMQYYEAVFTTVGSVEAILINIPWESTTKVHIRIHHIFVVDTSFYVCYSAQCIDCYSYGLSLALHSPYLPRRAPLYLRST